jgi:RNA polymerase sigma factor (sigma-70 family)
VSELLLSPQSDERLVSLARAGHERAFAAIVERYGPELTAMARRLCRDGRSEDVVQQAFLSAFSALRAGSEVRHLRGWLYQILRNAAGRLEAPPSVPLDLATVSADTVEDVVQQRAMAMSVLSEIARLPARQRQAMVGTALHGRARAEIASSMGLSEGAVRQLVHRARSTLRSAVTALTPWPLARWIAAMGPDAPAPSGTRSSW